MLDTNTELATAGRLALENHHGDLTNLMALVGEHEARKIDFITPSESLTFETINGITVVHAELAGQKTASNRCNDVSFAQVSAKAGIDVRTAKRFQEYYPDVLDNALNRIYRNETRNVMLRVFEQDSHQGILRAYLSDAFKRFDNVDMLSSILPALMESDADWKIVNASITDSAMTLRFKSDVITGLGAAVGDLMALGVTFSNSETGHGSAILAMLIWTLYCLNGMQTQKKQRHAHLTSSQADSDVWSVLTTEARDADNAALKMKLRDVATNYSSREAFEEVLQNFRNAASDTLKDGTTPQAAVEAVGRVLQLTKKETSSVLNGLFTTLQQPGYAGQPVSRATLVNAVTSVASDKRLRADEVHADDMGEWEKRGGRLLTLPRNQWTSIATAIAA
jgi:hypothetical protein